MRKVLRRPLVFFPLLVVLVLLIMGLLGGALGESFLGGAAGSGFLKSPIAHIQLKSESLTSELFSGFSITNTILSAWLSILVLAALAFLATRRLELVPRGIQNFLEAIIEAFYNLAQGIAGHNTRRFFPLFMTIFLFIIVSNWMSLLPGFGTIGRLETADHIIEEARHEAEEKGEEPALGSITLQLYDGGSSFFVMPFGTGTKEITAAEYEEMEAQGELEGKKAGILVPFGRNANTDLNTTLSIALVAMFFVEVWGIRTLGLGNYASKFLNFRRLRRGEIVNGLIDVFVGGLEAISEFARIISFTFRLFGNMFAGEVLLVAVIFLVPLVIGVLPMGLELFVGFIQAFIFAMLTLIFAVMAVGVHEAEEHR